MDAQHIRGYARSMSDNEEAVLQLAVKEYTPKNVVRRSIGVTIIASHANAFPEELYEPLWDDLFEYSQKTLGFRISSIWIADAANQGASGILNEGQLGNEREFTCDEVDRSKLRGHCTASWYDNARDLLLLVNHFRSRMTRPLIGKSDSLIVRYNIDMLGRLRTQCWCGQYNKPRTDASSSVHFHSCGRAYRQQQRPGNEFQDGAIHH